MSTKPAIRTSRVSKEFALGQRERYFTLRETLQRVLRLDGAVTEARKAAGRLWALKDVSFEVMPGEVVGIIGHNGAGKSTLLKILSRITEPTEGEVELFGRVSSLLEVGTGFHPELTGRENIYLNGSILGMKKREIDARFDEIVAFSGVEKFLETPVKRYSSGMTVRLAFAVAAHLEPEILLIDEVLAVGDAEFQRKCLGKMNDVARSGRTVLFVSHNMAAVENLCARVILLDQGQVVFDGAASEGVQNYATRVDGRQRGSGALGEHITRVEFHDGKRPVSSVRIGDGIQVRVAFSTPTPTQAPRLGIVFRRRVTGEPVFGVNSDLLGFAAVTPAREFEANFIFEKLNLVQGEYSIDIYAGADGRNHEVILSAADLHLVDADIFGTGKLPLTNFGPVFMPAKLTFTPAGALQSAAAE